ncbi:restriction endonuclease subunit S [Dechloromonas sp. H13]|uniref:restriction endonuclease subunit S n=1 Tax=Dechloromonas sp. H13 TaxID=2570193 RepID=UPI00129141E3|nr:restriction endonuclease subunit S [Dechloromonas sp. H13]
MERYESYKPSGVEWLGDIPSHWNTCRNIGVFDERKAINRPDLELLSVTINRGVIKQDEITTKKDSSNEDKSKYKVVQKNDLAYNKMRMWQGAIGTSEHEGIVSPAYIVLRPRDPTYSRFFHYLYRTEAFINEANRHSYGLCLDMNSLRYEDFKTIHSPLPPAEDVERIVTFLDKKTAEIDAAIAKKERLIELLQEQKSILINQAVTRGLNADVPMRDSGVEWIGKIPEHWKTTPLKHISTVQSGLTLGKNHPPSRNTAKYPYLRVANVQDGYINLTEVTEINLPQRVAKNYELKNGDILVTEGGDIDKLGRGACWNTAIPNCLHQNHVFAIRIHSSVIPEFVSLITGVSYARKYFTTTANKTTNLASTNKTKLGNLPVLVPPIPEQKLILKQCASIRAQYDELLNYAYRQTDALKEMKSIVITEAVTGKIKV